MHELSIIIPALNEEYYLPHLLDSIVGQKFEGRLQVIVVDGQSADKTRQIASSYASQLTELIVLSTKPDIGHQRNLGATQAKYDYLLFIDADVILPAGCLNHLRLKVVPGQPFIAAIFHRAPTMTPFNYVLLSIIYILFALSWLARTPVVNGDFILTTRNQHHKIGGFKEGAILGEDTEYGVRSVKAGAAYRFIASTYIIASDRRLTTTSGWKLLQVWSKAFLRARRGKVTLAGSSIDYPFGQYTKKDKT